MNQSGWTCNDSYLFRSWILSTKTNQKRLIQVKNNRLTSLYTLEFTTKYIREILHNIYYIIYHPSGDSHWKRNSGKLWETSIFNKSDFRLKTSVNKNKKMNSGSAQMFKNILKKKLSKCKYIKHVTKYCNQTLSIIFGLGPNKFELCSWLSFQTKEVQDLEGSRRVSSDLNNIFDNPSWVDVWVDVTRRVYSFFCSFKIFRTKFRTKKKYQIW